ncbi:MAG TPA: helix-turn-helix transcriptional regulator [Bryobacteraceae bacterium]|nr:helix-turn-helix transcriptional regulator [Bryobacteraceae bacterium]
MRQSGILTKYDPKHGVSVATLAYEYSPGFHVPEHAHGADQLIYAIRGAMEVSSGQSRWLVPPHFALWVPARIRHRIYMPGEVSMRTLYLRPGLVRALPNRCAVLQATPLLRELIVEIVRLGRLRWKNRLERALRAVTVAQIESASTLPTQITMPKEARARAAAEAVLQDPAQRQTLAGLCTDIGVSVRTMERLFRREVGTPFELWRRQARLMKAVQLLVDGCPVKQAAFTVGYRQPSAFVEAFRKSLGTTPKAWILGLEKLGAP